MVTNVGELPSLAPQALVVSQPAEFASVVLASSVLAPLRAAQPGARLYLLIQEKFAPLFVDHPSLDGIFTISPESTSDELAARFRKQKIDAVAHLSFDRKVGDAVKAAGIPFSVARAGTHDGGVSLEIVDGKKALAGHEAFLNFEVLEPFGVAVPERPVMELSVYKDAKREIFAEIAKKYGLDSRSSYAVVSLDPNRAGHGVASSVFAQAAECITRDSGMPIIVLGRAGGNEAFLRFSRDSHGAHVIDLRGKTTPPEDAWLVSGARLCFSGENAYVYLAVATECPLIALFVDFSAERWFPLGHLSTNIFTGARRFPLEPPCLYRLRAARAFKREKIASALRFSLALKDL